MRRRSFLATLPLLTAGAGSAVRAQPGRTGEPPGEPHAGPGAGGSARPEAETQARPPFQPPGADRFIREDVHAGDRPVGASFGSRSAAYGATGAVGAAHPLAVLAGIGILKAGGSAVDAAIAVNACLGFLEPTSSGVGGDVYAMLWDPKAKAVVGLAGSGRSPRGLSLEVARSRAVRGALPAVGAASVSVPGAVDGWWTLHRRYGKLPWARLFEPAIVLAEGGAPWAPIIGWYAGRNLKSFVRSGSGVEETANALKVYAPGGAYPAPGELFRNPYLARTYRDIAAGGRDAFYTGARARAVESYFKRIGGWMTADDLARHKSEWTKPFGTDYRGVTVHALGANTQGVATLQMLNILERFDLRGAGFQSALSIHLQAEAKRLAYEDRARFYADPDFSRIPTDWLVSKAYAAERAALIAPDRINTRVAPGQPPSRGDTTYFTTADGDGMMVSMIQSNFRGMGSGLVPDAPDGEPAGFMLQDRGQLFVLGDDRHPNIYAPGKRPFQTIIPGFATRGDAPWMSFGVMGGDMQPQGQTQIMVNRIDYGLDVQAAGDSPRWHHEGSSQQMGEDAAGLGSLGVMRLEHGVPAETRRALAAMGWPMAASDGGFGRYHAVEARMSQGRRVYAAASEMRADGIALAY